MKGVIRLGRLMKRLQEVKWSNDIVWRSRILREVITLLDSKHNFQQRLSYFTTEQKGHLGRKSEIDRQDQQKRKRRELESLFQD
jgi:hypothetical protein